MPKHLEFLANYEKEMEIIGSTIDDNEKINFVIRHFKDSAAQWYTGIPVSYTHLDVYKRQVKYHI